MYLPLLKIDQKTVGILFHLFLLYFSGKVAEHARKDCAVLEGTRQPTGTCNIKSLRENFYVVYGLSGPT